MKTFLFVLVTVSTLSFLCSGCSSENEFMIKVRSVKELEKFPSPSLPIESEEDAVRFAVRLEPITMRLQRAEMIINHPISWKIRGKLEIQDGQQWWKVRIQSSDILPSFTCVASFDSSGALISKGRPYNYCDYNK